MLQNAAEEMPRYEAPPQGLENVPTLLSGQQISFDPDAIAAMIAAYHAVLAELRLCDREDAGTRMVAQRLLEMAAQGERDPQTLAAATLEALSR